MSKNEVSYKDLYQLVDDRTKEIMCKFDALECRVSSLEEWRSAIKSQLAIIGGSVVLGVNFIGNWLYDRFVRGT